MAENLLNKLKAFISHSGLSDGVQYLIQDAPVCLEPKYFCLCQILRQNTSSEQAWAVYAQMRKLQFMQLNELVKQQESGDSVRGFERISRILPKLIEEDVRIKMVVSTEVLMGSSDLKEMYFDSLMLDLKSSMGLLSNEKTLESAKSCEENRALNCVTVENSNTIKELLELMKLCAEVEEHVHGHLKMSNQNLEICGIIWEWKTAMQPYLKDVLHYLNVTFPQTMNLLLENNKSVINFCPLEAEPTSYIFSHFERNEFRLHHEMPALCLRSVCYFCQEILSLQTPALRFPSVKKVYCDAVKKQCSEMHHYLLKLSHGTPFQHSGKWLILLASSATTLRLCLNVISSDIKELQSLGQDYQDMETSLLQQTHGFYKRVLLLQILQDDDGNHWTHNKPFYENDRCGFPIQMWLYYMNGLARDFKTTLSPDAAEILFLRTVQTALEIFVARYRKACPSYARSPQLRADLLSILLTASHFLKGVRHLNTPEDSTESYLSLTRIDALCDTLLRILIIKSAPLSTLCKVLTGCNCAVPLLLLKQSKTSLDEKTQNLNAHALLSSLSHLSFQPQALSFVASSLFKGDPTSWNYLVPGETFPSQTSPNWLTAFLNLFLPNIFELIITPVAMNCVVTRKFIGNISDIGLRLYVEQQLGLSKTDEPISEMAWTVANLLSNAVLGLPLALKLAVQSLQYEMPDAIAVQMPCSSLGLQIVLITLQNAVWKAQASGLLSELGDKDVTPLQEGISQFSQWVYSLDNPDHFEMALLLKEKDDLCFILSDALEGFKTDVKSKRETYLDTMEMNVAVHRMFSTVEGTKNLQTVYEIVSNREEEIIENLCSISSEKKGTLESAKDGDTNGFNPFDNYSSASGIRLKKEQLNKLSIPWPDMLRSCNDLEDGHFRKMLLQRWEFQTGAKLTNIEEKYVAKLREICPTE